MTDFLNKYPWITFNVDLRELPYTTWIQLGECLSKCKHIANVPLKPEVSARMHAIYLAKGVCATTSIEGNTLSEEQIGQIIDKKLELPPSQEYLKQEIDNILQLCGELTEEMCSKKKFSISIEQICRFNKVILQNVPRPDYAVPGEFRKVAVGVGAYKAVDPDDINGLLIQLCDWLNGDYFINSEIDPMIMGIIKAIVAHLYIEWIHPFGDGNGRVGRLLEFSILVNSGVPTPAAHLLSNHYNATRNQYYLELDKADKKRHLRDFIFYAVQGFRDGLTDQLKYIFGQVLQISWQNYVYEIFKEHTRSEVPMKRMRSLVLELTEQTEPVPRDKLITLSPKIIDLYKNGSPMMLSRDINELLALGLIEKVEKGYKVTIEKMLAFVPPCASNLS